MIRLDCTQRDEAPQVTTRSTNPQPYRVYKPKRNNLYLQSFYVELDIREKIYGTLPGNREIFEGWMQAKFDDPENEHGERP